MTVTYSYSYPVNLVCAGARSGVSRVGDEYDSSRLRIGLVQFTEFSEFLNLDTYSMFI